MPSNQCRSAHSGSAALFRQCRCALCSMPSAHYRNANSGSTAAPSCSMPSDRCRSAHFGTAVPRSRRPAPRRCTRHGTVGAFLCDRRPVPQCRSRRRLCPPAHCRSTNRRCPCRGTVAPFLGTTAPTAAAPIPAMPPFPDTPLAGVAERSRRQRCCSPSSLPAPPIAVFLVTRPWHSSSAPSTRCTRRRCSPLPPRACVLAHSAPAPTVGPSGGAASGQVLFPARFRQAHPTKAPRRAALLPSRFSRSDSPAGPWPTGRYCSTAAAAPHCRRIAPG